MSKNNDVPENISINEALDVIDELLIDNVEEFNEFQYNERRLFEIKQYLDKKQFDENQEKLRTIKNNLSQLKNVFGDVFFMDTNDFDKSLNNDGLILKK